MIHDASPSAHPDTPPSSITTTGAQVMRYDLSVAHIDFGPQLSRAIVCKANGCVAGDGLPISVKTISIHGSDLYFGCNLADLKWLAHETDRTSTLDSKGSHTKSTLSTAFETFSRICHPFGALHSDAEIPEGESKLFTIFSDDEVTLHRYQSREEGFRPLSYDAGAGFIVSNVTMLDHQRYFAQFSRAITRPIDEDGATEPREAIQYEVYLCLFASASESVTWFMHTTAAGSLRPSMQSVPDAFWNMHPKLPLLFWTLPGHCVRVSHTQSGSAPINVSGTW